MEYNLLSIYSSKLSNKQIKSICILKDKFWKHGIKKQLKWFKLNIKSKDIHNMIYIGPQLIGYTALRKRTYSFKNSKVKKKYLLFDTLTISKKLRGKKISNVLMNLNFAFLICNNNLIRFYKKNGWLSINNKNVNIMDRSLNRNCMFFNNKYSNKKKYNFFFNK